ncbi:MAG: acyl-CoA thioester hydrolase/BAAT C-terminal domain-containing protein [Acidobacteriaceae bacterium]
MISGGRDGIWPFTEMSDAIVARLKRSHFAYPVEHLNYAKAGHQAGLPYIIPSWRGDVINRDSRQVENMGGTVQRNAESTIDADPRGIEFLRQSLQGVSTGQP